MLYNRRIKNNTVMKQFHEENPPIEEDFNPWDDKERAV